MKSDTEARDISTVTDARDVNEMKPLPLVVASTQGREGN
jgi:hypothetical protein